jgi:hypothetical protein
LGVPRQGLDAFVMLVTAADGLAVEHIAPGFALGLAVWLMLRWTGRRERA